MAHFHRANQNAPMAESPPGSPETPPREEQEEYREHVRVSRVLLQPRGDAQHFHH